MSGHIRYTLPELRRLLALAKQLGFQDDIDHWEDEIKKLEDAS